VHEAIGEVAADRTCTHCESHAGIQLPLFDQP
jgi:hypothetical protein